MTGPIESVIGMSVDASVKRFETSLPERYKVAEGEAMLNGCIFEIDDKKNNVWGSHGFYNVFRNPLAISLLE